MSEYIEQYKHWLRNRSLIISLIFKNQLMQVWTNDPATMLEFAEMKHHPDSPEYIYKVLSDEFQSPETITGPTEPWMSGALASFEEEIMGETQSRPF